MTGESQILILPSAVWSGSAGWEMGKAVFGRTGMSWDYHQNESHIFSVEGQDVRLLAYPGARGPGHCMMSAMLFGMTQWCVHSGYGRSWPLMWHLLSKSHISKFLIILVTKVEPI